MHICLYLDESGLFKIPVCLLFIWIFTVQVSESLLIIFLPHTQTTSANIPVAHKATEKLPVYSLTVPKIKVSMTFAILAIMFMKPAAVAT